MPDSMIKFEAILAKIKSDPTYKFTDAEFSHANEPDILGQKIMGHPQKNYIEGWKRACEIKDAVLFRNGADARDIVQGALGDCFFLSACSVLGNKRISQIFISEREN